MEENNQLKESTCGCLNFTAYTSVFDISHTENAIVITVPFKKVIIPFSEIDKISFKKRIGINWFFGGCWQIEHHCQNAPKNIGFIPYNQEAWLSIFEQKGINIEDRWNLKKVDSKKWEKANRGNKIIGVVGLIAAIGAVVAILLHFIMAFLKIR